MTAFACIVSVCMVCVLCGVLIPATVCLPGLFFCRVGTRTEALLSSKHRIGTCHYVSPTCLFWRQHLPFRFLWDQEFWDCLSAAVQAMCWMQFATTLVCLRSPQSEVCRCFSFSVFYRCSYFVQKVSYTGGQEEIH